MEINEKEKKRHHLFNATFQFHERRRIRRIAVVTEIQDPQALSVECRRVRHQMPGPLPTTIMVAIAAAAVHSLEEAPAVVPITGGPTRI